MSFLAMAGWFLLGAVVTGILVSFWDDIKSWLNNTAADAVERALGYSAREKMHRAIVKIDRVVDKIRNKTVIYTKRHELDTFYDKTTLTSYANQHEFSDDVLSELSKEKEKIKEFQYRN